jgi:hypothetical protein
MSTEPLTAERLFQAFFAPHYTPEAISDLGRTRALDANPAANPAIAAKLDELATVFARLAPEALGKADLDLDRSDASVHRLGAALTREARDRWLASTQTGGGGAPPMIVNVVTHGAIYVGACVVANHGGIWQTRSPLWESLVRLDSRAGTSLLHPFSWWLKALSDDEIGEPRLADRYRAHVEVPTMYPEALPVIASPDRKLPRLHKVRYDMLYKHLRAHLPELRSVGDDFPSPERIEELRFKWLDFVLLGGGRMLLIHGPAEKGVHLFWLDLTGFQKSAYYPADAFPEHVVQTSGDKLRVVLPVNKEMRVHETLWWGS